MFLEVEFILIFNYSNIININYIYFNIIFYIKYTFYIIYNIFFYINLFFVTNTEETLIEIYNKKEFWIFIYIIDNTNINLIEENNFKNKYKKKNYLIDIIFKNINQINYIKTYNNMPNINEIKDNEIFDEKIYNEETCNEEVLNEKTIVDKNYSKEVYNNENIYINEIYSNEIYNNLIYFNNSYKYKYFNFIDNIYIDNRLKFKLYFNIYINNLFIEKIYNKILFSKINLNIKFLNIKNYNNLFFKKIYFEYKLFNIKYIKYNKLDKYTICLNNKKLDEYKIYYINKNEIFLKKIFISMYKKKFNLTFNKLYSNKDNTNGLNLKMINNEYTYIKNIDNKIININNYFKNYYEKLIEKEFYLNIYLKYSYIDINNNDKLYLEQIYNFTKFIEKSILDNYNFNNKFFKEYNLNKFKLTIKEYIKYKNIKIKIFNYNNKNFIINIRNDFKKNKINKINFIKEEFSENITIKKHYINKIKKLKNNKYIKLNKNYFINSFLKKKVYNFFFIKINLILKKFNIKINYISNTSLPFKINKNKIFLFILKNYLIYSIFFKKKINKKIYYKFKKINLNNLNIDNNIYFKKTNLIKINIFFNYIILIFNYLKIIFFSINIKNNILIKLNTFFLKKKNLIYNIFFYLKKIKNYIINIFLNFNFFFLKKLLFKKVIILNLINFYKLWYILYFNKNYIIYFLKNHILRINDNIIKKNLKLIYTYLNIFLNYYINIFKKLIIYKKKIIKIYNIYIKLYINKNYINIIEYIKINFKKFKNNLIKYLIICLNKYYKKIILNYKLFNIIYIKFIIYIRPKVIIYEDNLFYILKKYNIFWAYNYTILTLNRLLYILYYIFENILLIYDSIITTIYYINFNIGLIIFNILPKKFKKIKKKILNYKNFKTEFYINKHIIIFLFTIIKKIVKINFNFKIYNTDLGEMIFKKIIILLEIIILAIKNINIKKIWCLGLVYYNWRNLIFKREIHNYILKAYMIRKKNVKHFFYKTVKYITRLWKLKIFFSFKTKLITTNDLMNEKIFKLNKYNFNFKLVLLTYYSYYRYFLVYGIDFNNFYMYRKYYEILHKPIKPYFTLGNNRYPQKSIDNYLIIYYPNGFVRRLY